MVGGRCRWRRNRWIGKFRGVGAAKRCYIPLPALRFRGAAESGGRGGGEEEEEERRETRKLDGEKLVAEQAEEEGRVVLKGGGREREKQEGRGYPVCSQLNASSSFVAVGPRASSFAAPSIPSAKQLENAQT